MDEQLDVVIPDPFYALYDTPDPERNPETGLGIRVSKDVAERILVLGTP